MTLSASKFRARILPALVTAVALAVLSGCSNRVAVSGKVTVENGPLTSGRVTFMPDTEKGNTSTAQPTGPIAQDGSFELSTDGKSGAAPGWYKVLVVANAPADAKDPYAAPKSLIHDRYGKVESTDLSVEVKPGGTYDLKLSGPGKMPTMSGTPMPMPR